MMNATFGRKLVKLVLGFFLISPPNSFAKHYDDSSDCIELVDILEESAQAYFKKTRVVDDMYIAMQKDFKCKDMVETYFAYDELVDQYYPIKRDFGKFLKLQCSYVQEIHAREAYEWAGDLWMSNEFMRGQAGRHIRDYECDLVRDR